MEGWKGGVGGKAGGAGNSDHRVILCISVFYCGITGSIIFFIITVLSYYFYSNSFVV